jgi:hypothetical protein
MNQWVDYGEPGETAEVAVRRPKLAHAMLPTQRCDPRVMNLRPGDAAANH